MKLKTKLAYAGGIVIMALVVGYALVPLQSSAKGPSTASMPVEQQEMTSAGRVTMIDLGATGCIPCKMMAPIIEELKKEYAGRADIIFIDVWKDPDQAKKYGIRAIPTQIFFDAQGREVHRHVGFMDKQQIVNMLTKLGVS